MKTCTTEGAIALIEHGARCTQPLDLSGPSLALVVIAFATIGAAIIAAGLVRVIF